MYPNIIGYLKRVLSSLLTGDPSRPENQRVQVDIEETSFEENRQGIFEHRLDIPTGNKVIKFTCPVNVKILLIELKLVTGEINVFAHKNPTELTGFTTDLTPLILRKNEWSSAPAYALQSQITTDGTIDTDGVPYGYDSLKVVSVPVNSQPIGAGVSTNRGISANDRIYYDIVAAADSDVIIRATWEER